jgi:hypothetical protein
MMTIGDPRDGQTRCGSRFAGFFGRLRTPVPDRGPHVRKQAEAETWRREAMDA